ncbi:hypothetical protein SY88_15035 [Clostridiales bacterium PH28_bin88]|nr:hypothetical protein SY88_15035 [Clostridiales bacterium PH28_bin88]
MKDVNDHKSRVTVNIFDQEYIIKGTDPPQHLERLAVYLDKKMRQIGQKNPNLTALKVAVLAALHITDELSKLQEDYDAIIRLIEEEKKKG